MTEINKDRLKKGEIVKVGGVFYRNTLQRSVSGNKTLVLKRYKPMFANDEEKALIRNCRKFEDFTCAPSHTEYEQIVDKEFINEYKELSHVPCSGEWKTIEKFLRHIFHEQYWLGLDYFRLLWQHPLQPLPILLLVSKERQTGKTTFLNLLSDIFEGNFVRNRNSDFQSQFNSNWVNKLVIGMDEGLPNTKEDSELFKNLSTSPQINKECKGIDQETTDFFGKFVLCSNNVDNPVFIDDDEVRWWVRYVPELDKFEDGFREQMKKEIPAFLNALNTPITTKCHDRLWFTKEQIATDALRQIVKGNLSGSEVLLQDLFFEVMDYLNVDEIRMTLEDILKWFDWKRPCERVCKLVVRQTLNKWGLRVVRNRMVYTPILASGDGRYFFADHSDTKNFYTIDRKSLKINN